MTTISPVSALNFVGIFEMSVLNAVCTNPFVLLSVMKKASNVKCPVLVMLIVRWVVKDMVDHFRLLKILLSITSKISKILTEHKEPEIEQYLCLGSFRQSS